MTTSVQPVKMVSYTVDIKKNKNDNNLSREDVAKIGYTAGRCGVDLTGDPKKANEPKFKNNKITVAINNCTKEYFEDKMNKVGANFNRIA